MAWNVELTAKSARQIKKLDKATQRRIIAFLRELEGLDDPHTRGKGLTGNLRGLWRYRVGDYRLVCSLEGDKLLVLVLNVGHRSEIYT